MRLSESHVRPVGNVERPRMLRRLGIWLLAAIALTLTACSGSETRPDRATVAVTPTAAPSATATPAASAPSATLAPSTEPAPVAPSPTPAPVLQPTRFEQAPCPFKVPAGQTEGKTVNCGYVIVPESRSKPAGATIRLAVAVFKATAASPDPAPLIWLDGGPGEPSLDQIGAAMIPALGRFLAGDRDLVLFDQRGVGYSRPSLDCPELTEAKYANLDKRLSKDEERVRAIENTARCHDRLVREGINLAAYTSVENAADVNDIRVTLGYDKVNLYGVSYGARLALTVMRDFPGILRAAVLDSTFPPQANLYSDIFLSAQRAFTQLFSACAGSPACNAAYPDLESVFYAQVDRLNAAPVLQSVRNPYDGKDYNVLVTGDTLVRGLFQLLYRTDILGSVPRIIYAVRKGDVAPFTDTLRYQMFYDAVSSGMNFSVQCAEEAPFITQADVDAARRQVHPRIAASLEGGEDEGFFAICARWGAEPASPAENRPVSSDLPTLVLSGEYDPITPPAYAEAAIKTLTNAHLFRFPGAGHGVLLSDLCPLTILQVFLKNPATRPAATCINRLRGPAWVTTP
ncbi:MAG: alpha/beta fold hydrolase [Chloroflexi bacterium]|nr:alpha/beta fold hydrolase [Chloroflexota bacterium]